MSKRIFKSILSVAIVAMLLTLVVTLFMVYGYFMGENRHSLQRSTAYLAQLIDSYGDEVVTRMSLRSDNSICLIAEDGRLLYDNGLESLPLNLLDREEVQQALLTGSGSSYDYSSSFTRQTVYYAQRLEDGRILRLGSSHQSIFRLAFNLWRPLLLMLLTAGLVSSLLGVRLARQITRPINAMDLEHPQEAQVYAELRPLVRKIEHQNQQLQRQMDELRYEHSQRETLRKEFTANVSHELKTPLTSISGFAELIRDGLARPDDVSRFAGNIYTEAQRLISLVGDIIRLSQLEEDVPQPWRLLDLYARCAEVIEQLRPVAQLHGVRFRLLGQHAVIPGVERIIDEVIYNLCDNAIKYNKENGSVEVSVIDEGAAVLLRVRDTGIGIPAQDRQRIFERFYRVNKSHSKEIGGTGLGLSIVKHGAALHQASTNVESRLGVGTTISIRFPKSAPPLSAATQEAESSAAQASPSAVN